MIRRVRDKAGRTIVHVVSSYWYAGGLVAYGCCIG